MVTLEQGLERENFQSLLELEHLQSILKRTFCSVQSRSRVRLFATP